MDDMTLLSTEAEGVNDTIPDDFKPTHVNSAGRVGALLGLTDDGSPSGAAHQHSCLCPLCEMIASLLAAASHLQRLSACSLRGSVVRRLLIGSLRPDAEITNATCRETQSQPKLGMILEPAYCRARRGKRDSDSGQSGGHAAD